MNEELETMVISTDNGDVEVTVLSTFTIEKDNYIVLVPMARLGSEAPDILIYGYEVCEETESAIRLINISDEQYEQAKATFEKIFEEEMEEKT